MDCYLELAEKVRAGLTHIDPYFQKLADGMLAWVECWQKLHPETKPGSVKAPSSVA